ncbi:LOW QUALITY PROTEIN: hypothetical protein HID58_055399, partial [Brassica napus]
TIFPIIFRPTHLTKVLLPRSCPIDLEGISKGSTEATGAISTTAHIQSTSRVVHVRRTECDVIFPSQSSNSLKPPGPTRSEHEALKSFRFQGRIIRDYEFLHDVRRYLRVVRRRIGLHASTKCIVPPGEGMSKIPVFTQLLPNTELLHPRVRALQKIILQPISSHGAHKQELCATEVLRQEEGSRLSLQCKYKLKNSCFRAGQQITYSRLQQIQVIFTSQTYESCHPSTCKARVNRPKPATSLRISIRPLFISGKSTLLQVQTRPRPKKNREKEISERRPVHAKPKGPTTDKSMLMPTEASNVSPSGSNTVQTEEEPGKEGLLERCPAQGNPAENEQLRLT